MIVQRRENLIALEKSLADCQRCGLGCTRIQPVFGRGSEHAAVVLIGEGPGEQEDRQGVPFVGRAGQLLDKIIAAAELPADDVYICNIVKCRPPANRVPAPEEIEACLPYLRQQVAAIRPPLLVLLGATACRTVIDPKFMITKQRGQWLQRGDFKIMPTFHPSALLRDPAKKAPVWADFQEIKREYDRIKHGQ